MNLFSSIRPLFRIPLKYGTIGSIFGILLLVVLFYAGRHPLLIPAMLDFRILLFGFFIFFGLKEFREYHNDGILNFWQGMIISFIIYLTIGILVGLFIIIFSNLVPAFLVEYSTGAVRGLMLDKEQLLADGDIRLTPEEFDRQVKMLREMKPGLLAIDYILKSCVIGFFIAIILSVILRKTEKRFS